MYMIHINILQLNKQIYGWQINGTTSSKLDKVVVLKHLGGNNACLNSISYCTQAYLNGSKMYHFEFNKPSHRLHRESNDHTRIIGETKTWTSFRNITGNEPSGSLLTTSTHIYNIQHTVHTHYTVSKGTMPFPLVFASFNSILPLLQSLQKDKLSSSFQQGKS